MFDSLKESMKEAVDSIQEGYQNFTASMDGLQKDLVQLRDIFVSVRDSVINVFSFLGQQTSILLLCTFLFLFVLNLIPFLFFDKKIRYFIGIGFGAFLAVYFNYTFWATTKYLLIMLSPMIIEYMLVKGFRFVWRFLKFVFEKTAFFLKEVTHKIFRKLFAPKPKVEKEEKQV